MRSPLDILTDGVKEGVYPGGQLAASREGVRLISASAGLVGPQLEPVHNNVVYDLASLTKPLAAGVLLGRAVQDGRCSLVDPVGRYVPGVDKTIRLEHLLEHSSGYPAHERFDETLPATLRPGSWDAWRHIIFKAAAVPRTSIAGARAEYSDIGFILLGAALEIIYSKPLSLAYGLLGLPLLYRDTRGPPALPMVRPPWPIAPTEGCLPGEVHDENARAMGGAAGHAGLFGTAEGVLAVAEDLLAAYHGAKGKLLSQEMVRRLWKPSLVHGSTRTLGWDRPAEEGSSTGGRWPKNSVGHLGFTGTSLWIEPERGLCVVLITNRVCPTRANNTIRRLRPLLYDAAWEAWSRAPRAEVARKERRRIIEAQQRSRQGDLPTTRVRTPDAAARPRERPGARERTPAPRSEAGLRPVPGADQEVTQRILLPEELPPLRPKKA